MNPYAQLGSRIGTPEADALADRLAAWHDAMVAHERRLRTARADDLCHDECPHIEARTLWTQAVEMLGDGASELRFLQSRAMRRSRPHTSRTEAPQGGTAAEVGR